MTGVDQTKLVVLAACLTASSLTWANSYTFTDLGTLGGTDSYAFAINNTGQVVGAATVSSSANWHATIWRDSTVTDISNGAINSAAYAINDAGHVAGYTVTSNFTAPRATVWNESLETIIGGNRTYAMAINNAGQVAGYSYPLNREYATKWNGTTETDLGTLGGFNSVAMAINDNGLVVGYSQTALGSPNEHATLWNGSSAVDLGTLGGDYSYAYSINSAGLVVGAANTSGNATIHAAIWDGAKITDLGSLGGYSRAQSINSAGTAVGGSNYTENASSRATLWNGSRIIDLNNALDESTISAGWVLSFAYGINDSGWIVGAANNSLLGVTSHAFLLALFALIVESELYISLWSYQDKRGQSYEHQSLSRVVTRNGATYSESTKSRTQPVECG